MVIDEENVKRTTQLGGLRLQVLGPRKSSLLQALGQHPQPGAIPAQDLDPPMTSVFMISPTACRTAASIFLFECLACGLLGFQFGRPYLSCVSQSFDQLASMSGGHVIFALDECAGFPGGRGRNFTSTRSD